MSYLKAAHSYFTVKNAAEQKQLFLAGTIDQPTFTYRKSYNKEFVERHLLDQEDSRQLVSASLDLQKAHPTLSAKRHFRALNKQLYGVPDSSLVLLLLQSIARHVATVADEKLWGEVIAMIALPDAQSQMAIPSDATFRRYKKYFADYTDGLLGKTDQSLVQLLHRALQQTGLAEQDWNVRLRNDASPARVNHAKKLIRIGADYVPRSRRSKRGIVAHEVYGHALRGTNMNPVESEGFAIVLEQLLRPKFTFRRSYRYLAAAFGWGCDGQSRTFRQTYEIIWRLMMIASKYDSDKAKSHAFDECLRVYRGGRPDIAGMVFLKDTVYVTANIAVWKELERAQLSYNEFITIIEGNKKVLI